MFDGSIENPLALGLFLILLALCGPAGLIAVISCRSPRETRLQTALALGALAGLWLVLLPLSVLSAVLPSPLISIFGSEEMDTGLVEYATVLAWGLTAFVCVRIGNQNRSWNRLFYWAAAGVAIVLLGEEISWGQWIFFWSSPELFAQSNLQGETNAHNFFPPEAFEAAYALVGLAVAATAGFLRFSGHAGAISWSGLLWLRQSRWGAALAFSAAVLMQHHFVQELSELAMAATALYAALWIRQA